MDLAATGLLYGLGATLLLTYLRDAGGLRWWLAGLVAGLVLLLPWLPARPPLMQILPAQGALLLGLGMGVVLLNPPRISSLLVASGLLSAAWTSLLLPQWPAPVALVLPLAASAATVVLQLRVKGFATAVLRQDAALMLMVLGLALGLVPEIQAGWQSATALQATDGSEEIPPQYARGALLVSAASVVVGLLFRRWRYK